MRVPEVCRLDADMTMQEIRKKAPFYVPEWNMEDEKDFGIVLSKIFSGMADLVSSRLNEAPKRHFLSFLEIINTSIIPASPARVPLTFVLSEGASENVLIGASTQVSADGPDGKPVIFETEKNILATPSKLVSVYTVIKEKDKITDHKASINGVASTDLFSGESLQKHILYLGDENLFNLKEGFIEICFKGAGENLLKKLTQVGSVEWKYAVKVKEKKDGKEVEEIRWCFLGNVEPKGDVIRIQKNPLGNQVEKSEVGVIVSDKVKVNGVESRWISCQLKENNIDEFKDLEFTELKISVSPLKKQVHHSGSVLLVQGIGDIFYSRLAGEDVKNKIETIDELLNLDANELAERLGCRKTRAQNILEAAKKQFFDKVERTVPQPAENDSYGTTPDSLFYNDVPVDPSSRIYPFGKKPYLYDTFYIGSKDAFSKKGYNVTLSFKLTPGRPSSIDNKEYLPRLSWEYWDGESWSFLELKGSKLNESDSRDIDIRNLSEKDVKCSKQGDNQQLTVLLTVSEMPEVKLTRVNGKENYWTRARLIGGNYGKEYTVISTTAIEEGSFCPPQMENLTIEYSAGGADKGKQPEYIFTENNLVFRNYPEKLENESFKPFKPLPEIPPALYLGFDKKIKNGPISLLINIDENIEYPESFLPRIKWQYLIKGEPEIWEELEILDETASFTKKGTVRFNISGKMQVAGLFGLRDQYWIRAVMKEGFLKEEQFSVDTQVISTINEYEKYLKRFRPGSYEDLMRKNLENAKIKFLKSDLRAEAFKLKGPIEAVKLNSLAENRVKDYSIIPECKKDFELFNTDFLPESARILPPKVLGFYLNTTWAVQSRTINDEIIGSGTGETNQKLKLVSAPVITETIWVNEVNTLSEGERKSLLEDSIDIRVRQDNKGNVTQFWVRWTRVDDFLESSSKDRHYVVDRTLGEVYFGDGKHGMIPAIGSDIIKATYTIGGGKSGNLDALRISKLQTSIAFVDRVFNPIKSDGGTDTEDVDTLLKRAPTIVKNRKRAVAVEDYEWLAKEASRKVVKVKVLPNFSFEGKFVTGWVTVVIVPESPDAKPIPSVELKRKVTTYLRERCPAMVNLRVISPTYVRVDVSAELITEAIDAVPAIEAEAKKKISDFLHPLTGYVEKKGWTFGCAPCISDIYSILEQIKDVHHVNKLTISLYDDSNTIKLGNVSSVVKLPEYTLPFSGEHEIIVNWKSNDGEG